MNLKKPVHEIHALSADEVKKYFQSLDLDEKKFMSFLEEQNNTIKSLATHLLEAKKYVDEIKDIDQAKFTEGMQNEELDIFTRIKSISHYYETNGQMITKLVSDLFETQEDMLSKVKDLGYKHEKHDLKLFKKNESNIKSLAKDIKHHAKNFSDLLMYLQSQEGDEDSGHEDFKKKEEFVNAFYKLYTDLAHISIYFNKAIYDMKNIMEDDVRLKSILRNHLSFLENSKVIIEADERTKAFAAAKGNSSDPLYKGDRDSLIAYNKKLEELELQKTG